MLTAGTRLGPYEILAPLGAGGMGEVYRARDSRLDRDVAVKVLPENLAKDPQALSRFTRETKAVAALSHPNILAIFDIGTENGVSFAVTELLEGETLRSRLKRGALNWRKTVEIGTALAEGLAAAHSKSITHRDLKPDNIFLTSDSRVKILDFGLARVEHAGGADDETQTQAGMILGTPGYMSPEQIDSLTLDGRTDLFSLGCVLYRLATGKPAFHAATLTALLRATAEQAPPWPHRVNPAVPLALSQVILRLLQKKPEARYASALDLAAALDILMLLFRRG
jgi:serine/threonine protein kinase